MSDTVPHAGMRFEKNLVRSVFCVASAFGGDALRLPSPKEFALREFVNGVGACIGSSAEPIRFRKGVDQLTFARNVEAYVDKLEVHNSGLDPDISEAIVKLTRHSSEVIPYDGHSTDMLFYTYWSDTLGFPLFDRGMYATFSPSPDAVMSTYETFFPSLNDIQREHITIMGINMKPFIKEDVQYIHENFSW